MYDIVVKCDVKGMNNKRRWMKCFVRRNIEKTSDGRKLRKMKWKEREKEEGTKERRKRYRKERCIKRMTMKTEKK